MNGLECGGGRDGVGGAWDERDGGGGTVDVEERGWRRWSVYMDYEGGRGGMQKIHSRYGMTGGTNDSRADARG